MKRTPLKRKKGLRKTSDRMKLIKECEKAIRELLKLKRGNRCEACGSQPNNLGLSHILPKGRYPNLRLNEENLLLLCWLPCHYFTHHDMMDPRAQKVVTVLETKYGKDWRGYLETLNKIEPKLTKERMLCILDVTKRQIKKYNGRS